VVASVVVAVADQEINSNRLGECQNYYYVSSSRTQIRVSKKYFTPQVEFLG